MTSRTKRSETIVWATAVCLALALAGGNFRSRLEADERIASEAAFHQEYVDSLLSSKRTAIRYVGRKLRWTVPSIIGTGQPDTSASALERNLLLVFSDTSCDVCQDRETQFANELAAKVGTDRIKAIIHASDRRYAAAYARINSVKFPVYFDAGREFALANQITTTPLLLLTDDQGRVIAAEAPVPGLDDFVDAFHEACVRFLGTSS